MSSTLLCPEPLHLRESALAWCDQMGLDLSKMSPDDLYSRLRDEIIDADIRRNNAEVDYSQAEW